MDMNTIELSVPTPLYGGSFMTKINVLTKNLYLYLPSCNSKGIVETRSKKFIDFQLTQKDKEFIQWITDIEEQIQQLIFNERDVWFATDGLELDDIQNAFVPSLKTKGDTYVLRAYFPQKGVNIYDESSVIVPESSIRPTSKLISILDFAGVKFDQRSFQMVIYIKQIMIIDDMFTKCLIHNEVKEKDDKLQEVYLDDF